MSEVYVEIFDTTLRDGAQSLPQNNQFPTGSKPEIANMIAELGVGVIEAGFPATPGDQEEVREVAKNIGNNLYEVQSWTNSEHDSRTTRYKHPVIAGLSRTKAEDIEAAWSAVHVAQRPRIHTFISTDPEHMSAKFPDQSPEQVLRLGERSVKFAKSISSEHKDATVEFSAEAATTTDIDYLERVVKSAIDAGADIINLPDTVGQRNPVWMMTFYRRAIRWARETNPNIIVSAHNHNDLGAAVVNSYALIQAASIEADHSEHDVKVQVESTICGLGERAGNADVFSVVAQLFKFGDEEQSRISWEFNPARSVEIARTVMAFAGWDVPRQCPIVGKDTNVHRSGIHSDGVIKGGYQIYTPHNPTFWGHPTEARHEEGRYQGTNGRRFVATA